MPRKPLPVPKLPLPALAPGPTKALAQAKVNLTWLSRAIEDGAKLEDAIKEVYSMGIFGFAGDLRLLLKEVGNARSVR